MDDLRGLDALETLMTRPTTEKDWLMYYVNVWMRNCVARTVDIHADTVLKEKDPNATVIEIRGGMEVEMPVKARLENRKISLQDGLKILNSAKTLLAEIEAGETLESSRWSEDALKVADDVKAELDAELGVGEEKPAEEAKPETVTPEPDAGLKA